MASKQESAMHKRTFFIAVTLLGITTAQAQTVLQLNGQTSSNESTVASDTLSMPTSSPPSTSLSGSAIGIVQSDPLGVPTSSLASSSAGLASGGPGAMNAAATTSPQSPLLLRGEIPGTSAQAASATATAPGPSAPICAPPVPSTNGGSANLTEIAGVSLNGC
jgi:hypothetical protein